MSIRECGNQSSNVGSPMAERGGRDRSLTLQDVWEVHMPTQWYINNLVKMMEKDGAPDTTEALLAEVETEVFGKKLKCLEKN